MEASTKARGGPQLPVPDPVVKKHFVPCKAVKVLASFILVGLETGELKVYDKNSLSELSSQKIISSPVLKIE